MFASSAWGRRAAWPPSPRSPVPPQPLLTPLPRICIVSSPCSRQSLLRQICLSLGLTVLLHLRPHPVHPNRASSSQCSSDGPEGATGLVPKTRHWAIFCETRVPCPEVHDWAPDVGISEPAFEHNRWSPNCVTGLWTERQWGKCVQFSALW